MEWKHGVEAWSGSVEWSGNGFRCGEPKTAKRLEEQTAEQNG
jgi:hypothetical protein